MPTRREVIDRIRRAIAPLYEPREAEQIARRFTFERCGITLTQYVVAPEAQADIPTSKSPSASWPPDAPCNTCWRIPSSAA